MGDMKMFTMNAMEWVAIGKNLLLVVQGKHLTVGVSDKLGLVGYIARMKDKMVLWCINIKIT